MNLPQSVPRPNDVKHTLHKDVFHPNGERLLGFMMVSKVESGSLSFGSKKDNVHYLCCSATVKRPTKVFISRYRKPDKGEGYEQRRLWPLEQLTKVDGHDATSGQFDLYFDRVFRFEASSPREKEDFLDQVAAACAKQLSNGATTMPTFENVTYKIQKNLPSTSDVQSQMARNKQQLHERGQKISELESRTSDMADSAKNFRETARHLAEQYRK